MNGWKISRENFKGKFRDEFRLRAAIVSGANTKGQPVLSFCTYRAVLIL